MKIIDNKKDYYDYYVSVMGMDEKVTYDRRGSTVVSQSEITEYDFPSTTDLWFCNERFKCDTKRIPRKIWQSNSYFVRKNRYASLWKRGNTIEEGNIYHIFLEVGYHQFIIEVERYIDDSDKLIINPSIVEKKVVDRNHKESKCPIMISSMYYRYGVDKELTGYKVDNPILMKTWIPRLIPAQDMWNMLYEYISSLNDKEFVDTRTNDQHIESHGFDKKVSFRHRK